MMKIIPYLLMLMFFPLNLRGATLELFEAMEAKEIREVFLNLQGVEVTLISKQLSTLTCTKKVYQNSASVDCALRPAGFDGKEVYNNLKVPEVDGRTRDKNGRALTGTSIFLKSIGGLTCKRVTMVYPDAKPSYSCELQF